MDSQCGNTKYPLTENIPEQNSRNKSPQAPVLEHYSTVLLRIPPPRGANNPSAGSLVQSLSQILHKQQLEKQKNRGTAPKTFTLNTDNRKQRNAATSSLRSQRSQLPDACLSSHPSVSLRPFVGILDVPSCSREWRCRAHSLAHALSRLSLGLFSFN